MGCLETFHESLSTLCSQYDIWGKKKKKKKKKEKKKERKKNKQTKKPKLVALSGQRYSTTKVRRRA